MEQAPDHYAVLGIRHKADPEVIAAAYRALVKKFHPDTGNQSGTASPERFQAVQQAYEVLGDPARRRDYDAAFYRRVDPPPARTQAPPDEASLGQWTRSPGALPPGPREARDAPRRSPVLAMAALAAVAVLAVTGLLWFFNQPDPVAPSSGGGQTVTKQLKTDAPASQPQVTPAPAAAGDKPALFTLVMYEKANGVTTKLADGGLAFNSRKSCEDFAVEARQRRLDAATIETGSTPDVYFECREASAP